MNIWILSTIVVSLLLIITVVRFSLLQCERDMWKETSTGFYQSVVFLDKQIQENVSNEVYNKISGLFDDKLAEIFPEESK